MKFKVIYLNLMCLISLMFFVFFQKHNKEYIKFNAVVYKWDTVNNATFLLVKSTLTNNSADTFSYIVMSCYYPFFYKTSPNILSQEGGGCDRNIPELVRVPPHKNIHTIISLPIRKNINPFCGTEFRIGIYLTQVNKFVDLLKGQHILSLNPPGPSQKEYDINSLTDTSFKRAIELVMEKNSVVTRFASSATINLFWSSKIKL